MELYFLVNDYDNVISFANNIEKYSKVAIKFLHQTEIESIINQIYVSDE